MKKILLIVSLSTISYYVSAINSKDVNKTNQSLNRMVGGWVPIFFESYEPEKVNQINQQIKTNKIKAIKISYPHNMYKVAKRIKQNLSISKISIDMNEFNIEDTTTTKYRHDQVVVTVFY
jgi:hypothetical protein